jgi:hypothetical protein
MNLLQLVEPKYVEIKRAHTGLADVNVAPRPTYVNMDQEALV